MCSYLKPSVFVRFFPVVMLVFTLTGGDLWGQVGLLSVRRFEDFKNVEVVYTYPDFKHPVLRVYADSSGNSLSMEVEAKRIVKLNALNRTPAPEIYDKTVFKNETYSKRIIESLNLNVYIISLAMLHDGNNFVYGNFKYDLLLWKNTPEGYSLIALYPETIAGCLFCGANFSRFSEDSIVVEFNGGGVGEKWGGREYFKVYDGLLHLYKSERFRIFTPVNGKSNPIDSVTSRTIKKFFYDRYGRVVDKEINFDARFPGGSPVMMHCVSDSLRLYRATVNFPELIPEYLKTVFVGNTALRVGPAQGQLISVFWKGQWYVVYRKYLNLSSRSLLR